MTPALSVVSFEVPDKQGNQNINLPKIDNKKLKSFKQHFKLQKEKYPQQAHFH